MNLKKKQEEKKKEVHRRMEEMKQKRAEERNKYEDHEHQFLVKNAFDRDQPEFIGYKGQEPRFKRYEKQFSTIETKKELERKKTLKDMRKDSLRPSNEVQKKKRLEDESAYLQLKKEAAAIRSKTKIDTYNMDVYRGESYKRSLINDMIEK